LKISYWVGKRSQSVVQMHTAKI